MDIDSWLARIGVSAGAPARERTAAFLPHAGRAAAARATGNFVLLRADSLRLLLPQQDVGAAEHIEERPRATATPGLFEYDEIDGRRPVLALSGQLRPLPDFPADRFVLTRLMTGDALLSFAWNEVRVLIDADLAAHPLPPALRVAGAPIAGYVEHEGQLLLCSTAGQVAAFAATLTC